MLVTLPFVLLLLDYWPLGRLQQAERQKGTRKGRPSGPPLNTVGGIIVEKIPFLVLSVASSIVTYIAQRSAGAVSVDLPFDLRLGNAMLGYLVYVRQMFLPIGLAVIYPFPAAIRATGIPVWEPTVAAIVLAGITILLVRLRQRFGYLLVGWLWYLGTLVPVIGIVQVGSQPHADRYTYIPLIGLFIVVAWALHGVVGRLRHARLVYGLAAAILLFGCGVLTYQQVWRWKDTITLFQYVLRVTKNNYIAHDNLATALAEAGDNPAAIAEFTKSLEIFPHNPLGRNGLAARLIEEKRLDEALPHLQLVLRQKPDDAKAHTNLAVILLHQGKLEEGAMHLRTALEIDPQFSEAHYNYGQLLSRQEKFDQAIEQFRIAIHLNPRDPSSHRQLAETFTKMGKDREAIAPAKEALRLRPAWPDVLNNLAIILAASTDRTIRDPDQAIALASRACELTNYQHPLFLDTLGIAYASGSRFPQAIATAQKAHELALSTHQDALVARIARHIESYKIGDTP
jgi:tetratricopeptide (TPR) repeat protein